MPQQHLMFGTPEPVKSGGVLFRQETASAESFFLTGDGNLIDLRVAVQFRVKDARAFVYNVREPEALVRSITLAAVRAAAATSGIDAVYTTARSGLEQQVARAVQEVLDRSGAGINVLSVHLLYVHPPEEVHDAFRDVASAQEDKLRTINRANTFAVEGVNQSQGEAAAMIEQALGFKEQRIRRAEGDAEAFAIRLDAYKRDPELTKFRLRLEAAEAVLPGAQKIVTPGAADVKNVDMWLFQPFTTGGRR
jgi:HflK protein